jgi:hypothetical protein
MIGKPASCCKLGAAIPFQAGLALSLTKTEHSASATEAPSREPMLTGEGMPPTYAAYSRHMVAGARQMGYDYRLRAWFLARTDCFDRQES